MDYVITDNRKQQVLRTLAYKDGAQTHTLDYNPWADDNGTVTSVTLTLKTGQAAISNESLTSNVKTFVITTSEQGSSLIQAKATAGNNVHIMPIYILAKDPEITTHDYGLCG